MWLGRTHDTSLNHCAIASAFGPLPESRVYLSAGFYDPFFFCVVAPCHLDRRGRMRGCFTRPRRRHLPLPAGPRQSDVPADALRRSCTASGHSRSQPQVSRPPAAKRCCATLLRCGGCGRRWCLRRVPPGGGTGVRSLPRAVPATPTSGFQPMQAGRAAAPRQRYAVPDRLRQRLDR